MILVQKYMYMIIVYVRKLFGYFLHYFSVYSYFPHKNVIDTKWYSRYVHEHSRKEHTLIVLYIAAVLYRLVYGNKKLR